MKLKDHEKIAVILFGECPGCGTCDTCRVQEAIRGAWEGGYRSGRASKITAAAVMCPFHEWDWTDAVERELVSYTIQKTVPGQFGSRDEVILFVRTYMEKIKLWAEAKAPTPKKKNWTSMMKGVLLMAVDKLPFPLQENQPDLFSPSSSQRSPRSPSRHKLQDQQDTFNQALEMSKKLVSLSAHSTSQPTELALTLPAKLPSSKIPPPSP